VLGLGFMYIVSPVRFPESNSGELFAVIPDGGRVGYVARGGTPVGCYLYADSGNLDTVAWNNVNSGSTIHVVQSSRFIQPARRRAG
jgi:hypothetical protein